MPTAEPTWLTLPPLGEEISDELKSAMESFDAGERPAARAATSWLRDQALSAYETSRTRVLVADGRVAGFYALASSHAVATARRASALQATAVLAVDPFDEETDEMWRKAFGFRPSSEPGTLKRLWLPLRAVVD